MHIAQTYCQDRGLDGQRQVTDVYLLALAVRMGGRLATFDKAINVGAVVGATKKSLRVISAGTGA